MASELASTRSETRDVAHAVASTEAQAATTASLIGVFMRPIMPRLGFASDLQVWRPGNTFDNVRA